MSFFKVGEKAYGGDLLKTRKGRRHGRPLAVKSTMHLVLRSTKAKGKWSFLRFKKPITAILERFAAKYGVKLISVANVGNHLHLHIKLTNRHTYAPFIRAITAAIAMKVTGRNRWNKMTGLKFWDRRPFSRIVVGLRGFLTMRDYIRINQFEGVTGSRQATELLVRGARWTGTR